MNETLKTLITRRSVRNFKSDMIPEDILNQILLGVNTLQLQKICKIQ